MAQTQDWCSSCLHRGHCVSSTSLDHVSWDPEPLAALISDCRGCAMRFIRFRGGEDTIATNAATQPRCMRLLIGERTGFHRAELGRKQLGVTAADPKYDKRTGVADHCRTDSVGQLIGILVCECEVRGELACLRQQGRECVRAEGLELIHVHEKRYAIRRWKGATSHSNKLKVRHQERPEQIRCLLPIAPLARLATR